MAQLERYWKVTAEGPVAVQMDSAELRASDSWMLSHYFNGSLIFENYSRAMLCLQEMKAQGSTFFAPSKQKSLLTIWRQYSRIRDNWDRTKHDNNTWRRVFKIYSRYLVNIAGAERVSIPDGSDYMPGVAARIAFPSNYWELCAEQINRSPEFQAARAKLYPREVYAR